MSVDGHSDHEDVLARVRRLVREVAPAAAGEAEPSGLEAPDRLLLTPSQRLDRAPAHSAPVLLLSEGLRTAPPSRAPVPEQGPGSSPEPGAAPAAEPAAEPGSTFLDEATVRRLVAEAVREALNERAVRELVRREVLLMLNGHED